MTRRGFTLIEVLVALAVGSLVVLLAHRLFAAVADGTRRLSEARIALDRSSNARRWLIEAFGSLDVGTDAAGGFVGRRDRVEFTAWLMTAHGWPERRRVRLDVDRGALTARWHRDSVVLADSVTALRLDYLLEQGAEETWVYEWLSSVSAPIAVRLRIGRRERVDTLLLVIGPRG